jgi:tetratricopeptide (TPR) repeat protein
VIVTDQAGYRIPVGPQDLDLLEFRRLRDEARSSAASGRAVEAYEHYRSALGRWRGPALAGVDSTLVRRATAVLEEEHVQAHEECLRLALDLNLGEPGAMVAEIQALVRQHPYREALLADLLRALYRAGRQADALAAYREFRERLNDELGTEPGDELQRLHRAVLNRDPMLDAPKPAPTPTPAAATAQPVPRELPAQVSGFTGRTDALAVLNELLPGRSAGSPGPVVISAIAGTAGVGKTALAVHWAHRVADRFPDGQLYVNLRGFDPAGSPADPAVVVREFLEALAVPPHRMPATLEAQCRLYRSLLAGRRLLVVLDNARDAEQVRPLLPGSSGCLAVVTSRNQLAGLVATEGARLLTLDLFTHTEARQLLERRLGPGRVGTEPDAVDEIISQCARLPLALAIVAARAATRPGSPLSALAAGLQEARERLDAFAGDDTVTDVRAVFSWSYHALTPEAARLFRLLGLHRGPDLGIHAAASLAGIPPESVGVLLAELDRAHLVTERTPGRYSLHDLLRVYAGELAADSDDEAERSTALHRVLDHYLHTADTGATLLMAYRRPLALAAHHPGASIENLADRGRAQDWFTTEQAVLLAAVETAADNGLGVHAWQLATALGVFLSRRGRWRDLAAAHRAGLRAANHLGDREGQAHTHRGLARAYVREGLYDEARTHLEHALQRYRELGDHIGQGDTTLNLAEVLVLEGRGEAAPDYALRAHELYVAGGYRAGQSSALNNVGWFHALLGNYQQSLTYCQRALALQEELGDTDARSHTWDSLGYIHHHLGDHAQAIDCYLRAVDMLRDLGYRYDEGDTLTRLGDSYEAAGDHNAAHAAWQRALEILEDLDHPDAEKLRDKLKLDGAG